MAAALVPHDTASRRLTFDGLHGFSPLYRAYVAGDEAALQFFDHDWRSAASRAAAAEAALRHSRDRALLASILEAQNTAWGNSDDAALESIAALRDERSVAVVTGQQLGLFGGPLFTIYKAVTAVLLAQHMAKDQGRPVVPVFWLADEDHDWEEVRHSVYLTQEGLRKVSLPDDGSRVPVGRRRVTDDVADCISRVLADLPVTSHTPWLAESLAEAYAVWRTHRHAFASWLATLFAGTGLVLISGDEPQLKRQAAQVFGREIEQPQLTFDALSRSAHMLQKAGFHVQVAPSRGNLFMLEDDLRIQLDAVDEGHFQLRATGRRLSREDALAIAASHPERLSPNVILRPICEATLLPTAAYVAGPGEVAYYAQMRDVYEAFGVAMPCIFPRASVTIIEPRTERALAHLGLTMEDVGDGSDEHLEDWHRRLALAKSDSHTEAAFRTAEGTLDDLIDAIRSTVRKADPTLERSAESTRVRMAQALAALERKVVRAEKRKASDVRDRLEHIFSALMPGRKLQERGMGSLHFLNSYGPRLVETLMRELSLDVSAHQVIPAPASS